MEQLRAPFPYFGSKRLIADQVWQALGAPASYCEPFAGSAAVLLARPGGAGRIETINDLGGHVCNFWRAVKHHRAGMLSLADQLDYPVIEIDLHSRHRWLVAQEGEMKVALDADPDFCNVKAAAWWAWGLSAWIGSGWCSGSLSKQVPHIGDTGKGVHSRRLSEQVPSLSSAGCGTHARTVRLAEVVDSLADRMRRVRVLCGDWRRAVTPSALCDRLVGGRVGLFLDPPYAESVDGKSRAMGLYGKEDSGDVALQVMSWAQAAASEHPTWRIVLAGYEGENDGLERDGWTVVAWDTSAGQWGSGGYGRQSDGQGERNTRRERLWLSPACEVPGRRGQVGLF